MLKIKKKLNKNEKEYIALIWQDTCNNDIVLSFDKLIMMRILDVSVCEFYDMISKLRPGEAFEIK